MEQLFHWMLVFVLCSHCQVVTPLIGFSLRKCSPTHQSALNTAVNARTRAFLLLCFKLITLRNELNWMLRDSYVIERFCLCYVAIIRWFSTLPPSGRSAHLLLAQKMFTDASRALNKALNARTHAFLLNTESQGTQNLGTIQTAALLSFSVLFFPPA